MDDAPGPHAARRRLIAPLGLLALQAGAFWPVWGWYLRRLGDAPEDRWGLVPLVAALFIGFRNLASGIRLRELSLAALATLLYALAFPAAPPLFRAFLAVLALGITLASFTDSRLRAGLLGLMSLSLPLIPSLQFYAGYPLRVSVAALTAPLLRLSGFCVTREGTCLDGGGRLVWVDAPCSGVKMIWAGLFLCFSLACFYRLSTLRTAGAVLLALGAVLLGNVLRSAALFYVESAVIRSPSWLHEGVGAAGFAITAALAMTSISILHRSRPCAPCSS